MGPRSDERGKLGDKIQEIEGYWLQWGRAPMSAERRSLLAVWQQFHLASMGPRSDERGKQRPPGRQRPPHRRFNGAALR